MSTILRLMLISTMVCGVSGAVSDLAYAQLVSPFGKGQDRVPMDPEDMELMRKAMREALDKYTVGATSIWESKKSDRAGRAVVSKTFEMNGLRCAQLTHQFTKGPGATYTAPLCQVEDGSWKLAF